MYISRTFKDNVTRESVITRSGFKTIQDLRVRSLRVCPSKNVDLLARFCWIALGFDTFSHETIWSWSSRVWVGLCPLDTTKVSFSRKTRFWGRFLVLKAPTNLNCDHSTPYRLTHEPYTTLIHHVRDMVVSGSFLTAKTRSPDTLSLLFDLGFSK